MGNLVAHLRANAIAYLALFVALGGTAYAATKIDSGDVQNNSLKSADLKNGKAVKGADVKNEALKGADVDEATLDPLSVAASDNDGDLLPLDGTGVFVSELTLEVPANGQLLATATVNLTGDGGDDDQPRCEIQLEKEGQSNTGISGPHRITIPDTAGDQAMIALSGSAGVTPGSYTARVECDTATGGTASATRRGLLVWTIPD